MNIKNFDICEHSGRDESYGGAAGSKEGIIFNNKNYIIKFPKSTKSQDFKGEVVSYTTSPLSEYVGSHIYQILGYPTHNTSLGIRKNKLVVGCEDFRQEDQLLLEVRSIKNSVANNLNTPDDLFRISNTGDSVDLNELLNLFDYRPDRFTKEAIERFWECVVVDLFIENNDRNNGNWGFLKNVKTKEVSLAPIYDNGNSFRNKITNSKIKKIDFSNYKQEVWGCIQAYTYNDHRLSAHKLINLDILELKDAIQKVVPIVATKTNEISKFISQIPAQYKNYTVLDDDHRKMFIEGLNARLDYLLIPAFIGNGGGESQLDFERIKLLPPKTKQSNKKYTISKTNIKNSIQPAKSTIKSTPSIDAR